MKKIDVHIHRSMWENKEYQKGAVIPTHEQLMEKYEEYNVDKAIILPNSSPDCCFMVYTNEEAEYIAGKYPETYYWCCCFDPRMGENNEKTDFSYFLNKYKERGAIGVGEITCNLYADDPRLENLFYHCAVCDMPVTIHIAHQKYGTYGIIDEIGLPRLEKILKKYPDLKILGHSQCFWSEISTNVTQKTRHAYPSGKVTEGRIVELMRNYPNLYCDLSAHSGYNALSRDPDFAYKFIEEFSDRLMYGTDICAPNQHLPLAKWLDDAFDNKMISPENYAKICRENAIRIFKIKESL